MSETKPGRLESYTNAIKDAITILAGVAGIGYAAGFMVVSSSLMSWGITDVTLVKARYVSVGFLFLVHAALVAAPASLLVLKLLRQIFGDALPVPAAAAQPAAAQSTAAEQSTPPADAPDAPAAAQAAAAEKRPASFSISRFLRRLFNYSGLRRGISPAVLVLLMFALTLVLSGVLLYATSTEVWNEGRDFYFWNFVRARKWRLLALWYTPLFGGGLLVPLVAMTISTQRWLLGIPVRLLLIGGVLLVLLFAVRTYAAEIYPRTAPALGGGDFFLVKFTTGEDKAKTLAELMDMKAGYRPKWMWLLDQSDRSYFVLLLPPGCDGRNDAFAVDYSKMRSVEVPKDLIQGVAHYNYNLDYPAGCD
ncbi:MAG TPA: hypothetical protein VF546_12415 [Pyrinomonadaceae bacterium]|jgi:hypothetical protein